MATVQCLECGSAFNVVPARLKTAKFCSYKCRGAWRAKNFTGSNNPNFRGGRFKACHHCGKEFWVIPAMEHQKFCSKSCADIGGFRYSGKDHPSYREDARRRSRGYGQHKWATAVISRDEAKCQMCGAEGVELHAHHIKPYKESPELRWDVSNGITLCYSCHWAVHAARNEKAVNSVKPLTVMGVAEGNTEPSLRGNPLEGVTTRGRAYRRWIGKCAECGKTISKRLSDTKGKANLFCNHSCSSKFYQRLGVIGRKSKAVISSTSAAPEREEIV